MLTGGEIRDRIQALEVCPGCGVYPHMYKMHIWYIGCIGLNCPIRLTKSGYVLEDVESEWNISIRRLRERIVVAETVRVFEKEVIPALKRLADEYEEIPCGDDHDIEVYGARHDAIREGLQALAPILRRAREKLAEIEGKQDQP